MESETDDESSGNSSEYDEEDEKSDSDDSTSGEEGSEADNDLESDHEDTEQQHDVTTSAKVNADISKNQSHKKISSSDGESSDGDDPGKSCPIYLLRFKKDKRVAIPDGGCSHVFCVECLREWSKNVPTCPIDRSKFRNIIIFENRKK